MKISPDVVRHVALLARLRLSAEEEARLAGELDAILGYVDKLRELDTEGVPATSHAIDLATAFREDAAVNAPDVDALLENAPDRAGGFFRVPKIIE
ncbi:MAG: Asp-tRNA(Asn)/Glu-tRNA(Gln) amidotransferase subunit GatC [Candidatus Binatia bacterium]